MSQDTVKIQLEVASKAAEEALKRFKKQTDDNTASFNIFKGSFAAGLAVDAVTNALGFLKDTFSGFINEAAESQKNIEKLNFALQSTGRYTPEASKQLQDFAGQLQSASIYADDMVMQSSSLLANLTSLSVDGIERATQASADLAATLDVDLNTATEMIAKAVNGNTMAFSKLGIEIKKGKTDSENLANVLHALSNQQGAAEAQSKTYTGQLAKLNNAKSDLFEAIGNLVLKSPLLIGAFEGMISAVTSLTEFITKNREDILLFAQSLIYATGIVGTVTVAFYAFTAGVAGLTTALTFLRTAAATAWLAITGPVGLVVAAVAAVGTAIYYVVKYWDDIKIKTYEALAVGIEYASKMAGLLSTGLSQNLKEQAQGFRDKAKAIREAQAAAEEAKKSEDTKGSNTGNKPDEETLKMKLALAEQAQLNRDYRANVLLEEQNSNLLRTEEESRYQQELFNIKGEFDLFEIQAQNQKDLDLLSQRQAFEQEQLRVKSEAAIAKAALIEDEFQKEKAMLEAKNNMRIEKTKLTNQQEIELQKAKNKQSAELERMQIQNRKDTFSTIATLQNSNNKSLAAAGKAFAVYQIAADTPVAISKALASAPPPFNFALAGLVGVAMADQAAKVAGLSFQTGGIVPGNSYSGDKIQANINSREMVLNVSQQKRLFDMANGKSRQTDTNIEPLLIELINAVKQSSNTTVEIDGKEVFSVVKKQIDSGRTL